MSFSVDGTRLYYGDGTVVHNVPSVATPTPTPTPTHTPTPTPQPTVTLNLTVSLGARPAQGQIFRVLLSQAGIVRQDTLAAAGPDGVLSISGILPGQYDLWVKHPQSLAGAQPLVTLSAPTTDVTLSALLLGDANDTNVVNIADFSILAAAFGTSDGQPGYDARADFTGDSSVGISDFSLLAYN
ncbi:MAG: hypothetical protein L6Q98_25150, partial [Anaerolineae bacterium]|nr:hypothetical protein [Anaerolineae bacterium]